MFTFWKHPAYLTHVAEIFSITTWPKTLSRNLTCCPNIYHILSRRIFELHDYFRPNFLAMLSAKKFLNATCEGLGQDQASSPAGREDLLVRTMRDLDNINQVGLARTIARIPRGPRNTPGPRATRSAAARG